MGRRRRKVVKVVKRKIPDVFVCPKCGSTSIKVEINRAAQTASVRCSVCNIHSQIGVSPTSEPVDIYCKFSDQFYQGLIR